VRTLFFVLFSYFSKAETRIVWKVDVEVEVDGVERTWDIGLIHRRVRSRKPFVTIRRRV